MMPAARAQLLLALLSLNACAPVPTWSGNVLRPAALDVRASPSIWVLTAPDPLAREVGARVVAHLASGPAEVTLMDAQRWELARAGGKIPAETMLLRIDLSLSRGYRPDWVTLPGGMCDAWGQCGPRARRMFVSSPYYLLTADIAVVDPVTAAPGRRVRLSVVDDWGDDLGHSPRLAGLMVSRIAATLDQWAERVTVPFRGDDDGALGDVRAVLEHAGNAAACARVRALVAGPRPPSLAPGVRAAALVNAAWCQALAPGQEPPPDAALAQAVAWVEEATTLPAGRRYRRDLARLQQIRADAGVVRAQRAAANERYARARAGGTSSAP